MSELVFDPTCGHRHLADVSLGKAGYPVTEWVERCRERTLSEALEDLGAAVGEAVAFAISRGDWEIANAFAAEALGRNDPSDQ